MLYKPISHSIWNGIEYIDIYSVDFLSTIQYSFGKYLVGQSRQETILAISLFNIFVICQFYRLFAG